MAKKICLECLVFARLKKAHAMLSAEDKKLGLLKPILAAWKKHKRTHHG